ncbi:MAG: biotin/lipoyl-containing protein, partial [Tepidisphaeraceae bacterium]
MPTNVDIPALGESVTEATLIKWIKQDGDTVEAAEPIAELETDKANVDLPAPTAGVLRHVKSEGATVQIGDTIARIDDAKSSAGATPATSPAKPPPVTTEKTSVKPTAPAISEANRADLSPAVRRMVDENKLDPAAIPGTGTGGRITKEDVQKHLDARGESPAPETEEEEKAEADAENAASPA